MIAFMKFYGVKRKKELLKEKIKKNTRKFNFSISIVFKRYMLDYYLIFLKLSNVFEHKSRSFRKMFRCFVSTAVNFIKSLCNV